MFKVEEYSLKKLFAVHTVLSIVKYLFFFIIPIIVIGRSDNIDSSIKFNLFGIILIAILTLVVSRHIIRFIKWLDNTLIRSVLQQIIWFGIIIGLYLCFKGLLESGQDVITVLNSYMGWFTGGSLIHVFDRMFSDELDVRRDRKRLRIK